MSTTFFTLFDIDDVSYILIYLSYWVRYLKFSCFNRTTSIPIYIYSYIYIYLSIYLTIHLSIWYMIYIYIYHTYTNYPSIVIDKTNAKCKVWACVPEVTLIKLWNFETGYFCRPLPSLMAHRVNGWDTRLGFNQY